MLTVREALQLPVFAEARVVAGEAGLNRHIQWVHISDIPHANYSWGRPGVLLLTTGFGLRNMPDLQERLVPMLVEQSFAGLVLSTGLYFDETPAEIKARADAADFPIIETPNTTLFIDLSKAVLEQIINRQYNLLQKANEIHHQLTNLVLRGGTLQNLAETLAGLLKRSITIETADFQVLADAEKGDIDDARRRSVNSRQSSAELVEYLQEADVYNRLLRGGGAVYVQPMPHIGLTLPRIVTPVLVDSEIYGFLWIIVGATPLTELDELALGHGATVAALIMFKEQAIREATEAMRGDFFEQLIQEPTDEADFLEQAQKLQFRLNQPHQVLILRDVAQTEEEPAHLLTDTVINWFRQYGLRPLIVSREEGLVVVVESRSTEAGTDLARSLLQGLGQSRPRLLVSVGSALQRGANGISENRVGEGVRLSYEEAVEGMRVGLVLGWRGRVIVFEELGLLHWLYHLPPERRSQNVYLRYVQALIAYDARHRTPLIKTLEAYVLHGGSLVDTAEALHIHRNTLLHRLNRIEDVCDIDLRDPWLRLNLYAAIKSYQLHEQNNE